MPVRTFVKRDARHFVCNTCRRRFTPGEQAYKTSKAAYRHTKCPEPTYGRN